jgi:hypothetical protein
VFVAYLQACQQSKLLKSSSTRSNRPTRHCTPKTLAGLSKRTKSSTEIHTQNLLLCDIQLRLRLTRTCRSKKLLRLRHKEAFDLPPTALVGEVLSGPSALYAVWSSQAFSHLKGSAKSPSQVSLAASTVKFAAGVWTKVEPPKLSKASRKSSSSDAKEQSTAQQQPVVAAAVEPPASSSKSKSKSAAPSAEAAHKRDRR